MTCNQGNISLYHISHGKNLNSIFKTRSLLSHNALKLKEIKCENIAYGAIQERRSRKQIPIMGHGNLHDYVPFYFCPRSPMLGARRNMQSGILHFKTSVNKILDAGLKSIFSDGHAAMNISKFYSETSSFKKLDWDAIESWDWGGEENSDKQRKKQAEFLIQTQCPLEIIEKIGVFNNRIAKRVRQIQDEFSIKINVEVKQNWYFNQ